MNKTAETPKEVNERRDKIQMALDVVWKADKRKDWIKIPPEMRKEMMRTVEKAGKEMADGIARRFIGKYEEKEIA